MENSTQEMFTRWHDTDHTLTNERLIQKRKVDELLAPRFKVAVLYPYCSFKLGEIIKPTGNHKIEFYREFKVNLKELKWHEVRLKEEMPDYVKSKKYGIVAKLIGKTVIGHFTSIEDHTGSVADMDMRDFAPAAKYEWEDYLSKLIKK
jgi:hypothetical protein